MLGLNKHPYNVAGKADMNYCLVYRKLSSKWLGVMGTQNKSPSFRRKAVHPGKAHLLYFREPNLVT